jgi:hypothetical protein
MLNVSAELETSINHFAQQSGQTVDDFLSSLLTGYQSELECINYHAQELNQEAEDVLDYQVLR